MHISPDDNIYLIVHKSFSFHMKPPQWFIDGDYLKIINISRELVPLVHDVSDIANN